MKKATLLLLLAIAFAGCKKDEPSGNEDNPGTNTEQPGNEDNPGNPGTDTEQPGNEDNPGTDTEQPGNEDDPGTDTEQPGTYETVNIGGIEWMLHNISNPRQADGGATFTTKLPSQCSGTREESHGTFYQWGINVAWNSTGASASGATPSGSWTNSYFPDWNTNPCPDGYRLPTDTEFENLINSSTVSYGGGWSSTDYGYIEFTSDSKSVEFPAVGLRNYNDGALTSAGTNGYYWSDTQPDNAFAYSLIFASNSVDVAYYRKTYGFSVRCVRQ